MDNPSHNILKTSLYFFCSIPVIFIYLKVIAAKILFFRINHPKTFYFRVLLGQLILKKILSNEGVAPDAFHHLAAKRREVLAEFRRPLRHAIELFLLQKHLLVPLREIILVEISGIIA